MTASPAALEAVVLDPHPIWLEAIEIVLRRVGVEVVGKTSSGTVAMRLVEERSPDLL
jgi:DNA-binding NarL/FixJ family response regulator